MMKSWIISLLFIPTLTLANQTKEPITIAVVDMGIDYWDHPIIKKQMWQNKKFDRGWDFGAEESSKGIDYSYQYEREYHGTAIAYLLLRGPKNNYPFSKKLNLMDIVYADYEGKMFNLASYMFVENMLGVYRRKKAYEKFSDHIGQTLEFAQRNGSKIINFSSGDRGFHSEGFKESINSLKDKALIVVAAGNDGDNLNKYPSYPCSYNLENLICVGAINKHGKKTDYTNYGKDVTVYALGNHGGYLKGTSFAAPLVSQALALIQYQHPQWPPKAIKKEFMKYVITKNGLPTFDNKAFWLKYK